MRKMVATLILATLTLLLGLPGHDCHGLYYGWCDNRVNNASIPHLSVAKTYLLEGDATAVISLTIFKERGHMNMTEGCPADTCHNGGTCHVSGGFPLCACPDGYKGLHCEIEYPCHNNGNFTEKADGSLACRCATGYTGIKCEKAINGCSSNPCKNGGTCKDKVNGGYICECVSGYTGHTCDKAELECSEGCKDDLCDAQGICSNGCKVGFDSVDPKCELDCFSFDWTSDRGDSDECRKWRRNEMCDRSSVRYQCARTCKRC